MKIRLLTIALMAAIVGLGACGGGDDKSSEKVIIKFVVNNVEYQVNDAAKTITHIYPKSTTAAGTWPSEPIWPQTPVVTVSAKASYSPTTPQTFIPGPVLYTVTAEDGTSVTYTVKAEREGQN